MRVQPLPVPALTCPPRFGGAWGSSEPPQPLLAEAGGGGCTTAPSSDGCPTGGSGAVEVSLFSGFSPSRPGAEELQAGEAGAVQGGRPVPLHGTGSPGTPPHPAGGREQWGWERGSTPGRGGTGDFCTFECLTLFFSVRWMQRSVVETGVFVFNKSFKSLRGLWGQVQGGPEITMSWGSFSIQWDGGLGASPACHLQLEAGRQRFPSTPQLAQPWGGTGGLLPCKVPSPS